MKQEIFNESMRTGEFEKMFKDNRIGELLNSGDLSKEQIDLLIQLGKNISKTELEKRQNDLASQPGYEEYILSPMVAKILGTKTKKTKSVPEKTVEKTKKMKEKFDPGNLGKAFKKTSTSSMATKQPKEDTVITEKKPVQPKLGSINAGLYASIASTKISKLRKGDSVATIATKIYTVFKTDMEERKQKSELARNFGVEKLDNERRRHKELLDAIEKAKKKQPRVPVRDPKTGRYVKTEPIRPGAPSPKPAEVPKPAPKPVEAPKPAPKPVEAPKPAPKPVEAPKPAEVPKPAPKPAEVPVKPVESPKPAPKPAEAPKPTATKPPAKPEPAPTTTPVKPVTPNPAPPIVTKIPNILPISAAAGLSIERETGKSPKDAIKQIGQIVNNDPEAGVKSYGVFGINSGGSVQTFVADNPQFGLTAKPASKEFDEQWMKISKERPEEMLNAQLKWFDKNVEQPTKNMKNVPFINDPAVQIYMSDRNNQYGRVMLESALKYANKSKTPEEFIKLMSEFDLMEENLKKSFTKYLKTNPQNLPGLKVRIKEREKSALKQLDSQKNNSDTKPELTDSERRQANIQKYSQEMINKDPILRNMIKKENGKDDNVNVNINAPTTVINKQNPKQSISKPTSSDKPAIAGIP